ncbi:MAG: hypothetical protein GKR89_32220 [Candidatus Latescibacteria bacterium]|nr:hypothetical protein [Candidatus Latescibacterota bacterium]
MRERGIVDINAWTGIWGTFPVEGTVEQVRARLQGVGVGRICLAPLEAAWGHNPHVCNRVVYAAAKRFADIDPVPVIDPTIATWAEEVEKARRHPRVRLVKLLPNYSQYSVADAGDLLAALAAAGLAAIVQIRLEDQRRQHPLAQVPDTPIEWALEAAQLQGDLPVVIGGAAWSAIRTQGAALLERDNLWADISQADGMDSVAVMVREGLGGKLLFGSHAPLFEPLAGVARVVADLEDETALAILAGNARILLGD